MEYKSEHGIGTITDELYRLIFVGVPCYPIFRRFNEMFTELGGTFVNSTYLWFASGGSNLGFQYDLTDPLESLAEGLLVSVRDAMDSMFFQTSILLEMIDDFAADGVVYHPIKSCRTVSTGLADSRRALMEARDVAEPVHRVGHDGPARRVRGAAQEPDRRVLRGTRVPAPATASDAGATDPPDPEASLAASSEEASDGLCGRSGRRIHADQGGHHRRGARHRRPGAHRHGRQRDARRGDGVRRRRSRREACARRRSSTSSAPATAATRSRSATRR